MISRKTSILAGLAIVAIFGSAPGFAASDKPKASSEADAPAPKKKDAADAAPVSGDPQLTTATFGDWVERCQRVNVSGELRRLCEVAETVTASGQNAPLAELAIGRVKKTDPLHLTLVLPVNVGFPSVPKISLGDDSDPLELSWKQCVPAGCFAEVTFAADTQRAWRDAKTAKVESKAAGGQAFNFAISLRGLPQALDAMAREN